MNKFLGLMVSMLLVMPSIAFATGNGNDNNNGNKDAVATADATAEAAAAANASSVSGGGTATSTVSVEGDNFEEQDFPVNTAYSASLTSGYDTCMGSGSAGFQVAGVGATGGKTYVDANCVLIKQVQLLLQLGLPEAACERARLGEEGAAIAAAMTAAGTDCKVFNNPTPVSDVAPPVDLSPYATKEELNRAFAVSKRK